MSGRSEGYNSLLDGQNMERFHVQMGVENGSKEEGTAIVFHFLQTHSI